MCAVSAQTLIRSLIAKVTYPNIDAHAFGFLTAEKRSFTRCNCLNAVLPSVNLSLDFDSRNLLLPLLACRLTFFSWAFTVFAIFVGCIPTEKVVGSVIDRFPFRTLLWGTSAIDLFCISGSTLECRCSSSWSYELCFLFHFSFFRVSNSTLGKSNKIKKISMVEIP